MTDVVYLSVGDTTIPFRQYEGDTRAYVRGLEDAFRYLGVDTDVTETVVSMVAEKPQQVQKAFLLRVTGMRQVDIAEMIGSNQSSVSRYIQQKCADVRRYLERHVGIPAVT